MHMSAKLHCIHTPLHMLGLRLRRVLPSVVQTAAAARLLTTSSAADMAASSTVAAQHPAKTGYLFHELYMWHNAGPLGNSKRGLQPLLLHFENAETKRRMHNLLAVSGLLDQLQDVKPRAASAEEICRVHSREYLDKIQDLSRDTTKAIHRAGDELSFAPGVYEIAALAAGGAITLTDAVMAGLVRNGYGLVRPPGHHAERGEGMGFCVFNNVAVAAAHAMANHGLQRIAIVDWDVHHGNGTQQIFWEDDRVLLMSIHQDNNYPHNSGAVSEKGEGRGEGFNINIPLPPGSGSGAYRAAFDRVVGPAMDAFQPELVIVSSGFDGSYMDPLASMMLSAADFRYFTRVVMDAAERHCQGRLVAMHEGGYSEYYVPFCGLAVMEQLSGIKTDVVDPMKDDVSAWGYQALQPWQDAVIAQSEGLLPLLARKAAAVRSKTGA